MKKSILSPLCSAFVIPGLGQILNENLKKGLLLLGSVFVLFVLGTLKLIQVGSAALEALRAHPSDPPELISVLQAQDLTPLLWLGAIFMGVWIYAVVDAYREGKFMDEREPKG